MKVLQRSISILLFAALLVSLLSGFAFASRQTDAAAYLKNDLQKNGKKISDIGGTRYLYSTETVQDNGVSSTGPNAVCTRAQVVTFLYRANAAK